MTLARPQRIDPASAPVPNPARPGSVHARLYHIASQLHDPRLARAEFRKVAMAETGAIHVAHMTPTGEGPGVIDPAEVTGEPLWDESLRGQCLELCAIAKQRAKPQIQPARSASALFLVAAPIILPRTPVEVLLAVVPSTAGAVQAATMMVELVAAYQRTWTLTHLTAQMDRQLDALATLCELSSKVTSAESRGAAATRLANETQRRFGCLRVAVGLQSGRSIRVEAVSGTAHTDATSAPVHRMRQAMQETVLRGAVTAWPATAGPPEALLLAHEQLGKHCAYQAILSVPLRLSDGRTVGVWLLAGTKEGLLTDAMRRFVAAAAPHMAIALDACRRAEPGLISRIGTGIGRRFRRLSTWIGLAVLGGLVAALGLPVPSHVRCDCRVAPVVRRYAVAPFDGQLEAVMARPGDEVVAGQVLARLDGRQVRWDLASVEAERHQAARKHEVKLVGQDVPEAILASLELDRLNVQESKLTHRASQLEVTSPVPGVILNGLRDRVDGTPVRVGDVLFEVAPIDRLRIEIEVPSAEVCRVSTGQAVTVWLDGLGGEPRSGTLQTVAPESEVSQGQNVFIAEVAFDNDDGQMRPGMRGRVRIDVPKRRLGSILFQPLWEWLLARWS